MLRDITIGQHFPGNSLVHKFDPRLKLVLTIAYIILLFAASNPLGLALSILFLVGMYAVAKIPFKLILKSLKPILPIVVFTAVLNLFFVSGEGEPLVHIGFLTVYAEGVADILRRDPAKRRTVRRDKAYAALRSPWLHALLERMRIEGCYSAYYLPCRWRSIRLVWVMAEARRTGSPLFGKLDWAGYYLLGRRLRRD